MLFSRPLFVEMRRKPPFISGTCCRDAFLNDPFASLFEKNAIFLKGIRENVV